MQFNMSIKLDMRRRVESGEPIAQVQKTKNIFYSPKGPRFQVEHWTAKEPDFDAQSIVERPSWYREGHSFFDAPQREAMTDSKEAIKGGQIKFEPLGNIPLFNRKCFADNAEFQRSMAFMLMPFSPDIAKALGMDIDKKPWLELGCYSSMTSFMSEFRSRPYASFMAEARTVQDNQSFILAQFKGDRRLYVLDRNIGWNSKLSLRFILGWYAPLYDGTNSKDCPEFETYRNVYEAYMPENFVVNGLSIFVKEE